MVFMNIIICCLKKTEKPFWYSILTHLSIWLLRAEKNQFSGVLAKKLKKSGRVGNFHYLHQKIQR